MLSTMRICEGCPRQLFGELGVRGPGPEGSVRAGPLRMSLSPDHCFAHVQLYLHQLMDTGSAGIPPPGVTRTLASKACRHAIMFGDPLTVPQSQQLVASLLGTNLWGICAHGRPTNAPLLNLCAVRSGLQAQSSGAYLHDSSSSNERDSEQAPQQLSEMRHRCRRRSQAAKHGHGFRASRPCEPHSLGKRLRNALAAS